MRVAMIKFTWDENRQRFRVWGVTGDGQVFVLRTRVNPEAFDREDGCDLHMALVREFPASTVRWEGE